MARVNLSSVFDKVVTLFKKVFAKHTADGAASVLTAYLAEQTIVLADDETDVNTAVVANTEFDKKEKLMEEKSEERDDLFDPAFGEHKASVQFLKKFYRGNVTKLGEWTVTVDARGRVVYATDFSGKAAEVLSFIAHSDSLPPATNPLTKFLQQNEIDFVSNETNVEAAQVAHTEFTAAETAKEEFRAERDLLITPVEANLRGIGQFLVGHFVKNPKKAGQWGFVVDDSAQADKIRDYFINGGEIKTVNNLAVGKMVTNTGLTILNMFGGKTADGTPIVMNPGQSVTIKRGFGTATIMNTSSTVKGQFEGEFNA